MMAPWGADLVSRVVAACPGLTDFECDAADYRAIAALQPAGQLTYLCVLVQGTEADAVQSVGSIAAVLTSLRFLGLAVPSATSMSQLLPLTALQALTSCCVDFARARWHFPNQVRWCCNGWLLLSCYQGLRWGVC